MTSDLWYPSVDDVLEIHDDIVAEYSNTTAGIQNQGDIEFALEYVADGSFGAVPDTIHEKAFHLLRLLVANHPFVDGNKRTALNTVAVFYLLNGYRFQYDTEIRGILKQFGTDEAKVTETDGVEYLQTNTEAVDLDTEISKWRDELIDHGLEQLRSDSTDPNN